MNQLFLHKGFRRTVFAFSILKLLSPILLFLTIFPMVSDLYLIRLSITSLALLGVSLGTLCLYASLFGSFLYFKTKDPLLKIYLYSLIFHGLFFVSILFLSTGSSWSTLIRASLDFTLGGPMAIQSIQFLGRGLMELIKDPSYTFPFVQ